MPDFELSMVLLKSMLCFTRAPSPPAPAARPAMAMNWLCSCMRLPMRPLMTLEAPLSWPSSVEFDGVTAHSSPPLADSAGARRTAARTPPLTSSRRKILRISMSCSERGWAPPLAVDEAGRSISRFSSSRSFWHAFAHWMTRAACSPAQHDSGRVRSGRLECEPEVQGYVHVPQERDANCGGALPDAAVALQLDDGGLRDGGRPSFWAEGSERNRCAASSWRRWRFLLRVPKRVIRAS